MSSTEYITVPSSEHERPYKHPYLGLPSTKPRLRAIDLLVVATSLACCGIAFAVLEVDYIGWHLGYSYQLVVIGFNLSVMNMCLSYALPFLLLMLEARLGNSSLQNYEAIMRNEFFGAETHLAWRVVILAFTILPLGLSAAYKTSTGGINEFTMTTAAHYGMFAGPGMKPIGNGLGTTIMLNATLPYLRATNVSVSNVNGSIFPSTFPRAYGLNTLVLSGTAAAALDIPAPEFVEGVQSNLQLGESWNVSAAVLGTVTRQNQIVNSFRDLTAQPLTSGDDASGAFWATYANLSNGDLVTGRLFDGYNLCMLNNQKGNNQTWLFLGIVRSDRTSDATWAEYAKNAYMFSTKRESCTGTWTISQTSIQLVDGFCNQSSSAEAVHHTDQIVFENNNLGLDVYWMPTLVEFLGAFSQAGSERNANHWYGPTLSVTVASMMWARVTALQGPTNNTGEQQVFNYWDVESNNGFTAKNPGLVYPARGFEKIISSRQGLRSSPWLHFVLVLQPVLTLIAITLSATVLYTTPVDKSFGLVSILAGIDGSQERLQGAALTGKLARRVGLCIATTKDADGTNRLVYSLDPHESGAAGRLRQGWIYS